MRRIPGLCVLAVCFASLALAQEPAPAESAESAESAVTARHEGLRQLQAAMETALNARDLETLVVNCDENVVFTTMNGDVARGRDGIREYFGKMMEGPEKVVETITSDFIPDGLSVFYGDDMAIAFGSTKDHYVLADGRTLDIQGRWTATLVQKEARWLVAAFHYSTNVFDNPILDMQQKFLLGVGGGVSLVLAIIGFLVGRRARSPAAG